MVKDAFSQAVTAIERAVVGRRREVEALLAALLAEGHVLLEGPPGTAKTLLAQALAAVTGGTCRRVQFTPDLMPSDVTGVSIFDSEAKAFRFVPGPIFSDIVVADEINRAPAKTQAALLECMEERHVTTDGVTRALPPTFTVVATMNPIEFEGTFPLPEAQLDRFLMKIPLGELPLVDEQQVIARAVGGFKPADVQTGLIAKVLDSASLVAMRAQVRAVNVETSVQHYLLDVVRRTRQHPAVAMGVSTRAAVALLRACRARAACEGREFVIPDDVKFFAAWVLAHRLMLRPEAQLENVIADVVIADVLAAAPVPRAA